MSQLHLTGLLRNQSRAMYVYDWGWSQWTWSGWSDIQWCRRSRDWVRSLLKLHVNIHGSQTPQLPLSTQYSPYHSMSLSFVDKLLQDAMLMYFSHSYSALLSTFATFAKKWSKSADNSCESWNGKKAWTMVCSLWDYVHWQNPELHCASLVPWTWSPVVHL